MVKLNVHDLKYGFKSPIEEVINEKSERDKFKPTYR